jgi:hypothetical protein
MNPERRKKALEFTKTNVERNFLLVGLMEDFQLSLKMFERALPRFFRGATKLLSSSERVQRAMKASHQQAGKDLFVQIASLERAAKVRFVANSFSSEWQLAQSGSENETGDSSRRRNRRLSVCEIALLRKSKSSKYQNFKFITS